MYIPCPRGHYIRFRGCLRSCSFNAGLKTLIDQLHSAIFTKGSYPTYVKLLISKTDELIPCFTPGRTWPIIYLIQGICINYSTSRRWSCCRWWQSDKFESQVKKSEVCSSHFKVYWIQSETPRLGPLRTHPVWADFLFSWLSLPSRTLFSGEFGRTKRLSSLSPIFGPDISSTYLQLVLNLSQVSKNLPHPLETEVLRSLKKTPLHVQIILSHSNRIPHGASERCPSCDAQRNDLSPGDTLKGYRDCNS